MKELAKKIIAYESRLEYDLYIPIVKVFVGNKYDNQLLDLSSASADSEQPSIENNKIYYNEVSDLMEHNNFILNTDKNIVYYNPYEEPFDKTTIPIFFTSCKHDTNIKKV